MTLQRRNSSEINFNMPNNEILRKECMDDPEHCKGKSAGKREKLECLNCNIEMTEYALGYRLQHRQQRLQLSPVAQLLRIQINHRKYLLPMPPIFPLIFFQSIHKNSLYQTIYNK